MNVVINYHKLRLSFERILNEQRRREGHVANSKYLKIMITRKFRVGGLSEGGISVCVCTCVYVSVCVFVDFLRGRYADVQQLPKVSTNSTRFLFGFLFYLLLIM